MISDPEYRHNRIALAPVGASRCRASAQELGEMRDGGFTRQPAGSTDVGGESLAIDD